MRHGITTALALGLMLAACSDDDKPAPRNDASTPARDGGGTEPEGDAGGGTEDAGTASALPRPSVERPPTSGLPASLRPPR